MSEQSLRVRWLFEDPPNEWVRELVSYAETECIADFSQTHDVAYVPQHLPSDAELNEPPRDVR